MRVLSIDIGFHNMGLAIANSVGKGPTIDIEYIKKVSLEDYKYLRSNDFVDLIPLFVEDHQDIFDSVDKILIERQPPGGFTNIEILLHYINIDIPYERKHDIADAICMILYYNFKTSVHFFDKFKLKV